MPGLRQDTPDATTADLVRSAAAGDLSSFGRLVERYEARVRAVALALGADRARAEDVAQETFVAAHARLADLEEPAAFAAWIVRVARNRAATMLRRESRGPGAPADVERVPVADPREGPPDALEREALREDVRRALESLDERERLALTLRHHAGLTYAEIGDAMTLPFSTVKGLIYRGTRALKDLLRDTTAGPSPRGSADR
jgi:RNA polymerase sigma-70 factor (ECF subfamily)